MDSSSQVGPGGSQPLSAPKSPPLSSWKTYSCAIVIIVGIGGLAVGAVGLAGALSNMAQVKAIIMMAAGGGGGTILLIIGVVGIVKNCRDAARQSDVSVYGRGAWESWNVEIVDIIPQPPKVDPSKKDAVLLYIPEKILVGGEEKDFTLKVLKEMKGDSFRFVNSKITEPFGDTRAPGWVLIDKKVIRESRDLDYESQERMVRIKGYSMPNILEAVLLNLMVFASTGERLYGTDPWTYTHCTEKVDGKYPVAVGGFNFQGLEVRISFHKSASCGVACVRRNFS